MLNKYIDLINETLKDLDFSSDNKENYTEIENMNRYEDTLSTIDKETLIIWADTVYKSKWFLSLYKFYSNYIVNRTIKGRGEIDSAYFMLAGLTLFKKEFERLSLNYEDKEKIKK